MLSSASLKATENEVQIPHAITNTKNDPYEIEKCANWIDAYALQKVCLQFPDNLLQDSTKVTLSLEEHVNKRIYILGDTTCGSCCVDEVAAQHVNADGIIHFGHACLNPTTRLPVFYVFPKRKIDVNDFCNKFKQYFQDSTTKILFFYDVAYAYAIECIYNVLKDVYKDLIISKLYCTSNVEFITTKQNSPINILGRSYTLEDGFKIEDYESFFLGESSKTFVTLAVSIPAMKWYYYENNNITIFDPSNIIWLKRRRYLVEKLKDARVIGIVVATLAIKDYLMALTHIKNILKEKNKKCYILSVGKLSPQKLANFPEIEAFVVITCPENEVFELKDFLRPMLMPYEVDLAFNSSRNFSTQYYLDFRQILPGGISYVDFKPSADSDVSLISGSIRNIQDIELNPNEMNALMLTSPGTVAIGKAGAQFLQNRSWKGVEQRLGEDTAHLAETGRGGLPTCYDNEPILEKTCDSKNKVENN